MKLQKNNLDMDELKDLIHVYENALEVDVCNFLITLYEEVIDKHEKFDNNGKPNFTQFNFTENRELSPEINRVHNHIIHKVFEYRNKYYDFVDKRVFPDEHALEQFRIKKYETNGTDQFDTHVDVVEYGTARRYLSFLWYLNDVNDGGKTVFKEIEIQPKQGTLIMFPPMWMYPHRGEPPISNPKYIMSTYLHYK